MARKIFVGSLPQNITEDELRKEFEPYGEVEEVFIKDCCLTQLTLSILSIILSIMLSILSLNLLEQRWA
jgi:RNA recognition motif-containing protein